MPEVKFPTTVSQLVFVCFLVALETQAVFRMLGIGNSLYTDLQSPGVAVQHPKYKADPFDGQLHIETVRLKTGYQLGAILHTPYPPGHNWQSLETSWLLQPEVII